MLDQLYPIENNPQLIPLQEYVNSNPVFAGILESFAKNDIMLDTTDSRFHVYRGVDLLEESEPKNIEVVTVKFTNGVGFMYTAAAGSARLGTNDLIGPGAKLQRQALNDLQLPTVSIAFVPDLKMQFFFNPLNLYVLFGVFNHKRFLHQVVMNSGEIADYLRRVKDYVLNKVTGIRSEPDGDNLDVLIPEAVEHLIYAIQYSGN